MSSSNVAKCQVSSSNVARCLEGVRCLVVILLGVWKV